MWWAAGVSNAALTWAFPLPITGPNKAVLVALANHADDIDGTCWPSIERLALFSGYGVRAVRRSIKELQEFGLITFAASKGYGSHRYAVNVGAIYETRDGDRWHENPAPQAKPKNPNPAPQTKEPGTTDTNPAPQAKNPAPQSQEPSLTPIEPSEEPPLVARPDGEAIDLFGSKPKPSSATKRRPHATPSALIPAWVPLEAWSGYLEMRKKKNKPATDRAIELALAKLAQFHASGHSIMAVLDQSTMNGWTDLYAPKDQHNGHNGMNGHAKPNLRQAAYDAIMGFDSTAPPPPADHDYIDLERGDYADA